MNIYNSFVFWSKPNWCFSSWESFKTHTLSTADNMRSLLKTLARRFAVCQEKLEEKASLIYVWISLWALKTREQNINLIPLCVLCNYVKKLQKCKMNFWEMFSLPPLSAPSAVWLTAPRCGSALGACSRAPPPARPRGRWAWPSARGSGPAPCWSGPAAPEARTPGCRRRWRLWSRWAASARWDARQERDTAWTVWPLMQSQNSEL